MQSYCRSSAADYEEAIKLTKSQMPRLCHFDYLLLIRWGNCSWILGIWGLGGFGWGGCSTAGDPTGSLSGDRCTLMLGCSCMLLLQSFNLGVSFLQLPAQGCQVGMCVAVGYRFAGSCLGVVQLLLQLLQFSSVRLYSLLCLRGC